MSSNSNNKTALQTAVPLPELGQNGYDTPEESKILSGVQTDMNIAFGGNLDNQLTSPQGQLAQSLAAIIADRNAQFAYYVNQIDPNYAEGRMQDAIGRIYFIERKQETFTTVYNVECRGAAGTFIQKGTLAKDESGNLYQSLEDEKITQTPPTITVTFHITAYASKEGTQIPKFTVISDKAGNQFLLTDSYSVPQDKTLLNVVVTSNRFSGAAGSSISKDTVFQDSSGNTYSPEQDIRIPSPSTALVTFQCMNPGPIACPAGALNQIHQLLPGWDSIYNPQDGILGTLTEGRAAFEFRRRNSVAANAVNSMNAIRSAVMSEEVGAVDAYVTENFTDKPINIDDITLKPHSIYVCVSGSTPEKIAKAIWHKKPPGCGMNGDTHHRVEDDESGYMKPYPTYDVWWQTARPVPLKVEVLIARDPRNTDIPPNVIQQVQDGILKIFENGDQGQAGRIGAKLYAASFLAALPYYLSPGVQVVNLLLNGGVEFHASISEIATLTSSNIQVSYYV